jgi:plastocyanin
MEGITRERTLSGGDGRRHFLRGLLRLGVLALGGAAWPLRPATAAKAAVRIDALAFEPKTVTVRVGDSVTWENTEDMPHMVVGRDGAFRSKTLQTGNTFTFRFQKAGRFPYSCSRHPYMTGLVVVNA